MTFNSLQCADMPLRNYSWHALQGLTLSKWEKAIKLLTLSLSVMNFCGRLTSLIFKRKSRGWVGRMLHGAVADSCVLFFTDCLTPGFQHSVVVVPELWCRCRSAVAVPLTCNGIGWKPFSITMNVKSKDCCCSWYFAGTLRKSKRRKRRFWVRQICCI